MVKPVCDILVCVHDRPGTSPCCARAGGREIAERLKAWIHAEKLPVELSRTPCQGRCSAGPALRILPGPELFLYPDLPDGEITAVQAAVRRRIG